MPTNRTANDHQTDNDGKPSRRAGIVLTRRAALDGTVFTSAADFTTADDLDDELAALLQTPTTHRVATARVTASNRDMAQLELVDGSTVTLPAHETPPTRPVSRGDQLRVLVSDDGMRASASAVRPELVAAMFEGIVPELQDGTVRIMGVARAPGRRTKIAVAATADDIDPVAALVGRHANRVKAVGEMLDEQLDVVAWHSDDELYVRNALAPVSPLEVVFAGTEKGRTRAVVSVAVHQLSAAVGEAGLNSFLAGQLTGTAITVVTPSELEAARGELDALAAANEDDAADVAEQPGDEDTSGEAASEQVAAEADDVVEDNDADQVDG